METFCDQVRLSPDTQTFWESKNWVGVIKSVSISHYAFEAFQGKVAWYVPPISP
jgi:hypothetical protein